MLSILTENWLTWYLGANDFEPRLTFLEFQPKNLFLGKFGPKSQSCAFCLKIGRNGISRMLILILTLNFWISNSKFPFGQVWAKNGKAVRFA